MSAEDVKSNKPKVVPFGNSTKCVICVKTVYRNEVLATDAILSI